MLPVKGAKNLKKGAQQLKKIHEKLEGMYDIFEFFINGDWTYINNHVYTLINRMSDQEKEEFNCDVLKIEWS